jgi:hypothetical protein
VHASCWFLAWRILQPGLLSTSTWHYVPEHRTFLTASVKLTQWLESASELYRPTERPPLVGDVSANFGGYRVSRGQRNNSPTVVNFGFLDRSRYFLEIANKLSSRGGVDPIPDPLLLRKKNLVAPGIEPESAVTASVRALYSTTNRMIAHDQKTNYSVLQSAVELLANCTGLPAPAYPVPTHSHSQVQLEGQLLDSLVMSLLSLQ